MNKKQLAARGAWLKQATDIIYAARADLSGKLEWDDLIFHFNQGNTPEHAAQRYLENHHA
mgnify:CR=1 FL=1